MRLLLVTVLAASQALAWNHVGHKAIAGIAYDLLTPAARARVDELIRSHPDYNAWLVGAPEDSARRARHAFMQSAFWPDTIRGDPRFYDESRADQQPTSVQPGFPDMKRRTNWHYINVAFSPDGTAFPPPPLVNVLSQIKIILNSIGTQPVPSPGSVKAEMDPTYLLPWLLHLGGDVHNPMHCTSRWKKDQVNPQTGKPWSDLGGNGVFVTGAYNLHALWDDALGITDSPEFINGLVRFLARKEAPAGAEVADPDSWVREGAAIAENFAYSFGYEHGTKDNPVKLNDEYLLKAKAISRERAMLAGRRLALVLNARLQ